MTTAALPGEVRVLSDPVALAGAAAQWLRDRSAATRPFRLALSGGTTPRLLYDALASSTFQDSIDWPNWHVYFGDERAVPPGQPDSNYHMVSTALLSRVPIPPKQVHRMDADDPDLDGAAARYSSLIARECGQPPRLDTVLLGLGADGHTASLFPGTPALEVMDSWATRGYAPQEPAQRMTLTFPAINAAAHIAFLVTGSAKTDALRGIVAGSVPAARVQPDDGELVWFLDAAAAASLG